MRAFQFIWDWVPIYTLASRTCFNPKSGSVPPETLVCSVYDYEDDGLDIGTFHVLAVCSDQEDGFERRPSRDKLNAITELAGRAPRWFVSCGYAKLECSVQITTV